MLLVRTVLAPLLTLTFLSSLPQTAAAQKPLSVDEKALSTYRLTMPNVKKVMAVAQIAGAEAAKDPKVQELQALEKQIEALEDKDELTAAEEAQLEKLRERRDVLENEEDEDDKDDGSSINDAKTIAEMEAAMKKHPAIAKALAQAGISPREYSMTMMALLQAMLAEGMSQGKLDLKNLPPGINPENILFIREHKAELEAMQKQAAKK